MLLILPILVPFTDVVEMIGGTGAQMIANAHLIFNLITAAVFLLVIGQFKRLVERAVPGSEPEILMRARYLEGGIPDDTHLGFELIRKELQHAHEVTLDLFRASMTYLATGREADYQMVEKLESLNDYLDERIEQALRSLSTRALSGSGATGVVYLARMSNEIERLGDLGADLGEFSHKASGGGKAVPAALMQRTESIYRILEENIVGLGIFFPGILDVTVAELRARDVELQRAINDHYREHLVSLHVEGDIADSSFLEILSIIEAANAKVRDLRKLAEQYSREKRGETPSPGVEKPFALGDAVAGDNLQGVADLPIQRRVPGVDVQEGRGGELGGRGDHDEIL